MDENDLLNIIRNELFTAVLGDVLDAMGHTCQFLPPGIAPLDRKTRLVGRAMTVLEADVFAGKADTAGPLSNEPFGLMLKALDDLKPGEIYMAAGASPRYALWGGLMSTRAMHLGAVGAVLDGFARDARDIEALGFPVFCRGLYAQDQSLRGKVIDYRCDIEIGGVRIKDGDLIFGDREGVLVIPRDAEAEAVTRALEKVRTENKVGRAIKDGMSAQEAFDTFGVM